MLNFFISSIAKDHSSWRPCIHFVSCLSLTRHWPPTLKAGNSFRLTIRCTVRPDNCSTSAVSLRVSRRRNGSSSFSIGRAYGATPMPLRYRVAPTTSADKRPLRLLNRPTDRGYEGLPSSTPHALGPKLP